MWEWLAIAAGIVILVVLFNNACADGKFHQHQHAWGTHYCQKCFKHRILGVIWLR